MLPVALAIGQVIVMAVAPRRSSTRMSWTTVATGAGSAIGTNAAFANGAAPAFASRRHLCTTLALIPCDIATLATDAPG